MAVCLRWGKKSAICPTWSTDLSAIAWPFITHTDAGVAEIAGVGMKVLELAIERLAYGWKAQEIHRQHPELSLPQIHAALGYYVDHRDECDRQIEDGRRLADDLCDRFENTVLLAKLRSAAG